MTINSGNFLRMVFVAIILIHSRAFHNSLKNLRRGADSFSINVIQKYGGKSVSDGIRTTSSIHVDETTWRSGSVNHAPVKDGFDERHATRPSTRAQEAEMHILTKIEKNYRHRSLLEGLVSDEWGHTEKIHRVSGVSAIAHSLPSTPAPPTAPRNRPLKSGSIATGRLLDDWEFEM
jgi:hypothetical protein